MRWFTIFSLRYALLESPSDERRFPRQPQLPNTSKIGDNHCYHADMAAVCDSNHRAVAWDPVYTFRAPKCRSLSQFWLGLGRGLSPPSCSAHARKPERCRSGCWTLPLNHGGGQDLEIHLATHHSQRAQKPCTEQHHGAGFRRGGGARAQLGDGEIASRKISDHNAGKLSISLRSK